MALSRITATEMARRQHLAEMQQMQAVQGLGGLGQALGGGMAQGLFDYASMYGVPDSWNTAREASTPNVTAEPTKVYNRKLLLKKRRVK